MTSSLSSSSLPSPPNHGSQDWTKGTVGNQITRSGAVYGSTQDRTVLRGSAPCYSNTSSPQRRTAPEAARRMVMHGRSHTICIYSDMVPLLLFGWLRDQGMLLPFTHPHVMNNSSPRRHRPSLPLMTPLSDYHRILNPTGSPTVMEKAVYKFQHSGMAPVNDPSRRQQRRTWRASLRCLFTANMLLFCSMIWRVPRPPFLRVFFSAPSTIWDASGAWGPLFISRE